MSRMYGIYVGIKKYFRRQFFTILTVGQSDVSLQRPTLTNTTIANHGHCRQKWPPSTPHKALRYTPMRWMDGQQPSEQAGLIFGAVEGVHGPQNSPMLWQFITDGIKECFEGNTHPQPPQKIHPLAWGVVMHPFVALAWSASRHVGR